jgi:hypothetical protein
MTAGKQSPFGVQRRGDSLGLRAPQTTHDRGSGPLGPSPSLRRGLGADRLAVRYALREDNGTRQIKPGGFNPEQCR